MRKGILSAAAMIAAMLAAGGTTLAMAASFPDPPKASAPTAGTASIVLAGGCFWGMQGIYEHMKGVTNTVVGYAGGTKETAHYDIVSERTTNHAESIKITYDPSKVSYGELLKVFFSAAHDPTTLNKQHYDEGPEYRSAIFYSDDEQKNIAEMYIKELNDAHVSKDLGWEHDKIVTQVVPLKGLFFPAEPDHQHFLDHNPTQGYIANIDIPLQNKFKAKYPEYFTKDIK
jgi:peptide-methionine (S)-S-oxide reductase